MSPEKILFAGALLAGIGVALGAFGAHGLENQLQRMGRGENAPQRLAWFETGVRYHLFHALALVVTARFAADSSVVPSRVAPAAFVIGIVLFSGSLYAMSLADDSFRRLGAVVPLGGLSFLVGWAALAIYALRAPPSQ